MTQRQDASPANLPLPLNRLIGREQEMLEIKGLLATTHLLTLTGIEIYRFEGGKIVEHWLQSDMLGLLQQLGVVPSMA